VRFSARRELAVGLATYGAYLLVREVVLRRDGRGRAQRHAERLVSVERRVGVDLESHVQAVALRAPRLLHGLNAGYALFNVMLTVGLLWRGYLRRASGYHRHRRAAVIAYAGALPVFLCFPVAPPRALGGYVDTLAEGGIDLEHPLLVRFYNPVAAMPSLHLAFAVITADVLRGRGGAPWRLAAAAYPPVVAATVVATGNHYVLDVVAGAALGGAARALAR